MVISSTTASSTSGRRRHRRNASQTKASIVSPKSGDVGREFDFLQAERQQQPPSTTRSSSGVPRADEDSMLSSPTTTGGGDFQVLRQAVEKQRRLVLQARSCLASALDQLGEHHVRRKEYDDAMDAFAESLYEKRSVVTAIPPPPPPPPPAEPTPAPIRPSDVIVGSGNRSRTSSLTSDLFGELSEIGCASPKISEKNHASISKKLSNSGNEDVRMNDDYSTTSSASSEGLVKHPECTDRGSAHPRFHDPITVDPLPPHSSSASAFSTWTREQSVDEIATTLRNMGNVHSLRGEHDEAMRYFTEVTSLRAQKLTSSASTSGASSSITSAGAGSSGVLTGATGATTNDDNSTLMSEINEDVKALDDLFRSISFRHRPISSSGNADDELSAILGGDLGNANFYARHRHRKQEQPEEHNKGSKSGNEKRKSNKNSPTHIHSSTSNKRRKNNGTGVVPSMTSHHSASASLEDGQNNEPFHRVIKFAPVSAGNSLREALDTYKSVMDSYEASELDMKQDREQYNSLALRANLIGETASQSSGSAATGQDLPSDALELAIEVYQQVLALHNEYKSSFEQSSHDPDTDPHISSSIASTLISMGSIYYKLDNRNEELRMYREAKTVYRKAFGESHAFVAGTRKNIGMVLAERGEYDAAMAQFEKAKQIYLRVAPGNNGDGTRDVASAILCMGNVKNRVGELDSARIHYMEALKIYQSILERVEAASASQPQQCHGRQQTFPSQQQAQPSIPAPLSEAIGDVTSTLKVIGMVHVKEGDLDTAMGFFQEAIQILRSSGADRTASGRETTASLMSRIGSIHLKKGDLDRAMLHYRESYDLTVQNRGTSNHQEVAGILHHIGGIYHKRAEYDEAMACYQEAIRIYHATLGPANPAVASTLVMVGSIHYKRRKLDSAMMFYREALRLNRDSNGMLHPDVAPILKSVGTILTKKGDYREAYDIFRDVLSIKCTVYGTGHPEVANAYKSLGNVHYKLGELANAERQYRHALSIYRRTKGEDHADTLAARTTIEHLRYWMREREQRKLERRHSRSSGRSASDTDERSC